jgi:hypothetical protein
MKKRLIALLGMGIALSLVGVLVGCTFSSFAGSNILVGNDWKVSGSANGDIDREIDMSTGELAAFSVESTNTEGTITLEITQFATKLTIDISGSYSGAIDLSDFSSGKIKVNLKCENVKGMDFHASW